MPQPTSLDTRMMWPGRVGEQFDQGGRLALQQRAVDCRAGLGLCRRLTGEKQVGQPQRQAIDQHAGVRRGQFAQFGGQLQLLFGAAPVARAAFAVVGDAARHFAVAGFGGGQVDDAQAGFRRPLFGQQALARTGAAEDEFFMAGTLGDCAPSGKPDNSPRFDETEPGARFSPFRGGPAAVIGDGCRRMPLVTGQNPAGKARQAGRSESQKTYRIGSGSLWTGLRGRVP